VTDLVKTTHSSNLKQTAAHKTPLTYWAKTSCITINASSCSTG